MYYSTAGRRAAAARSALRRPRADSSMHAKRGPPEGNGARVRRERGASEREGEREREREGESARLGPTMYNAINVLNRRLSMHLGGSTT
jgi:hypothetical protein